MFKVLILVCSIDLAPQDCQIDNALDVILGPTASNEITCGLHGQAYVATTPLAPTEGHYLKVKCTRSSSRTAEIRTEFLDSAPTNQ